jgi:hypothetical protein
MYVHTNVQQSRLIWRLTSKAIQCTCPLINQVMIGVLFLPNTNWLQKMMKFVKPIRGWYSNLHEHREPTEILFKVGQRTFGQFKSFTLDSFSPSGLPILLRNEQLEHYTVRAWVLLLNYFIHKKLEGLRPKGGRRGWKRSRIRQYCMMLRAANSIPLTRKRKECRGIRYMA